MVRDEVKMIVVITCTRISITHRLRILNCYVRWRFSLVITTLFASTKLFYVEPG